MSHEPTNAEVAAAFRAEESNLYPPNIMRARLTAANTLRDRRIRDEALKETIQTLEKFGYENGRQECCGRGVPNKDNTMEECCGNPDLVVRLDLAADAIRALKDKEPNHE